ncbi:hypothetical protein GCM10027276_14900 [Comamonas piscis]
MSNYFKNVIIYLFLLIPLSALSQACNVVPEDSQTSKTSGTFRIYAHGISAETASTRFPTWGQVDGQDDLVWYEGINQGNGTWYADIDMSRHKPNNPEYGRFDTHVYVRTASGAESACGGVTWTRVSNEPSCGSAEPSVNTTIAHEGFLRVYARDVLNAQKVQFPTWGEMNEQDDVTWYEGVDAGSGTWYADIDLAKHKPGNPEYGRFNTHVYVTSSEGVIAFCATEWQRPQIIAFSTGNPYPDWKDTNILPNGQLAMAEDIRNAFCDPICPDGRFRIGMKYTLDLMQNNPEIKKQEALIELKALINSAKINNFYFYIHTNHEWILPVNANPFKAETMDWAEYTDWGTPLTAFSNGWGRDENNQYTPVGLKPNFESAVVRRKIKSDIDFITNFIKSHIHTDPIANSLFMGVDFGWETEVSPSVIPLDPTPIGYAALANRINPINGQNYGPDNPPSDKDFHRILGDVSRDFILFIANEYENQGVSKSKLFTHITTNILPKSNENAENTILRRPYDASSISGTNLGVSCFCGASFDFERINAERKQKSWTITEADPITALASINGGNGSPPPAGIIVYNWSDTMRRPFGEPPEDMIPKFRKLFNS